MAFTFFFRDQQTLDLVQKYVIPEVKERKYINLWDAGCAMGPEPYTLAITFAENLGHFAFKKVRILASDIDESNLFADIIRNGEYPEVELKRIPRDIFHKYFTPAKDSGYFKISEKLKNRIEFRKHDLLTLKPLGSNYHMILCKNVLLHFKYEERVDVMKMFHDVLAPEGLLAVEQTQKLPSEIEHLFTKVVSHGQLFRKV